MNREDIIKLAQEAGFDCAPDGHIYTDNHDGVCDEYLERFAALVAAAAKEEEREACAKVCDTTWNGDADTYDYTEACNECASAVRARGETK